MRNTQQTIMSGASSGNVTGSAINVNQVVSASFQFTCADNTAAGTVKIQASNDAPTATTPTNWTDVTSGSQTVTSGAAAFINIAVMNYQWIRAVFTRSGGGSATVATVQMNAQSV